MDVVASSTSAAGGSSLHRLGTRLGTRLWAPGRARSRTTALAVGGTALALAAVVTLVATAGAAASRSGGTGTGAGARAAAGRGPAHAAATAANSTVRLILHPMPVGTVRLGRASHGKLLLHVAMYGLTPGSQHYADLVRPGGRRVVRFSILTATSVGQARTTLTSSYAGRVPAGSRVIIRMGAQKGRLAATPIALTTWLSRGHAYRAHRLRAVEVSKTGRSYGTPHGHATLAYNAGKQTLTVTVSVSGVTPGDHAAHIHLGSCQSQGPVKYMIPDLVASRRGRITRAVRVFTHVTSPIPATGWYLNFHQGTSKNILTPGGQPTIYFRPLVCANIKGPAGAYASILKAADVVTGVRGGAAGQAVLTGIVFPSSGTATKAFLYQGKLPAAGGQAVSVRTPPFAGLTSAAFYGPDTHQFNPGQIPAGKVRAVGSYTSSSAPSGVDNLGLIYLGPVSGAGGSWTSITVPAHGRRTDGGRSACPRSRPHCTVMDTIPHSTMGDLVVGDYDLTPGRGHRPVSANAFVYNLTTRRWTLLALHGSQSTKSTFYGIWQNGGASGHTYTIAGGSGATGHAKAFLISYNERTGRFGQPHFYREGNGHVLVTHFEGITKVTGGYNLVAMSTRQTPSLAFIPVSRTGRLGRARWYAVQVASSSLCAGGCSAVSGNTVWQNDVMGLYKPKAATVPGTYLATGLR